MQAPACEGGNGPSCHLSPSRTDETAMRTYGWALPAGLVVLLAAAGSMDARAQGTQALGPDSFLVAVPIRDTVEIQRELGSAVQAKTRAERDRAHAESLRNSARARITRKQGEISAIKDREKTARSEKRSADAVALEGTGRPPSGRRI